MKNNRLFLGLLIAAVPILIYSQFSMVRANVIYGDDLYNFHALQHIKSFDDIMNLTVMYGKYRPVSAIVTWVIFCIFKKNLVAYYFFNVAVQTANTYVLAFIINLLVSDGLLAVVFSLLFALTRFSFFTCSQVFNGGSLEGLALLFFLLSVFFMLRAARGNPPEKRATTDLWRGLLFANISLYTHERYIVLLPFLFALACILPGSNSLTRRKRAAIAAASLVSVLINVAVKKWGYSIPFFMGTGGRDISFSWPSALGLLKTSVWCIFQINKGNLSHTGIEFYALPLWLQCFVALLTAGLATLFSGYLFLVFKSIANRDAKKGTLFLFILLLAMACLIPAVITIRVEQRWLQASFCLFIVMIAIAFANIPVKSARVRHVIAILFVAYFLKCNYNYLVRGLEQLYITDAQEQAAKFAVAMDKGIISPNTAAIYIWKKERDDNFIDCLNWDLGNGYIFEFYQNKPKKIVFVHSGTFAANPGQARIFPGFSKDSAQVLYAGERVSDITPQYLKDSLRSYHQ